MNNNEEKEKIKIGSFINLGNFYNMDKISHGSETYNRGYCLIEKNNELYLANTITEEIYTDEGAGFELDGPGKHNYMGDIIDELGLSSDYNEEIEASYTYIEPYRNEKIFN